MLIINLILGKRTINPKLLNSRSSKLIKQSIAKSIKGNNNQKDIKASYINIKRENFILLSTIKPNYLTLVKSAKLLGYLFLVNSSFLYYKFYIDKPEKKIDQLSNNFKDILNEGTPTVEKPQNRLFLYMSIVTFLVGVTCVCIFKNFVTESTYSQTDGLMILNKLDLMLREYETIENISDLRLVSNNFTKPFATIKNRRTLKHYAFTNCNFHDVELSDIIEDKVKEIKFARSREKVKKPLSDTYLKNSRNIIRKVIAFSVVNLIFGFYFVLYQQSKSNREHSKAVQSVQAQTSEII